MSIGSKIKGACTLARTPYLRFYRNAMNGRYDDMPDDEFLKKMYKLRLGNDLDLEDPKKLSEKLQWLKLYNRHPEYTAMVDKYEAKKIAAKVLGEEHVNPTLAVWDRPEDIDIKNLPDRFVLKVTHDSGGFVICKDKASFDIEAAKAKLGERMKRNFYRGGREWPYKNVVPRIIAEPFIDSLGKEDSVEYKLTCFDGKLGFSTICKGIAHSDFSNRHNDSYDRDFNLMPWYAYYTISDQPMTEKPAHLDEMIEMAEKLSAGIPYLRCDFYVHDDRVYFGEMTFFTWSGFLKFNLPEWDEKLGDMLKLPAEKYTGI